MLGWILSVTAAGSLAALTLSASLLLLDAERRKRLIPYLIGYATGTLLGASLLALLPEALERQSARRTLGWVLAGIVLFFLLERWLIWRHCHEPGCEVHGARAPLILIGDALHNFADGAVIAAGFLTSVPLGVMTALAVFSHEIPQEVGDFAILLSAGYSRSVAFWANLVSASSAVLGAAVAYAFLNEVTGAMAAVTSLAAASFLYLALADLLPALHREQVRARAFTQALLLLFGIGTIVFFRWLET